MNSKRLNMTTKKNFCILNKIRKSMPYFYVHHETFSKLTEKYKPQILDSVLSKYSKHSRSVGEIEDRYNEISKYLKHSRSAEIRSQPEETITKIIKLMHKKNRNS